MEWGTPLEAMEAALELEKTVNQSLLDLPKILCFQKVTEMSISFVVRSLVEIKKTLVYSFLQLQGSLHGLQRSAPLHAAWLGNILEDNSSSTLSLVGHQLHSVLTFFI